MFQPILPLTGYVGWRFLERTQEAQEAVFSKSQPIAHATDNFREKISAITSAADLVADRSLLSVALGAFGLDEDIDNKFYIQKILSEGTTSTDSLANRLSDKSYAALSSAFGFGDPGGPFTGLSGFANRIVARYETKQFQRAVGDQNNDMRIALSLKEGLADISLQNTSKNAQWFAVMGSSPVRAVFETALGLPSSIAQIDIDQQLTSFKNRAQKIFGTDSISDFSDPEKQEKLVRMYLIRSEANASSGLSSSNIALSLLQSIKF
jgi:hypothetical protein